MNAYQHQQCFGGMEGGSNLVFRQSTTVVDMATTEADEPIDYSMNRRQPCLTPAEMGFTRKMPMHIEQEEDDQDMVMGDTCLGEKGTDLYRSTAVYKHVDLIGHRTMGESLPVREKVDVKYVPAPNMEGVMAYNDEPEIIDIGLAKKKVIPADKKDEISGQIGIHGVQQEVRHKRPCTPEGSEKEESRPLSPDELKNVSDVITKISENKKVHPQSFTFNPKKFSGFENLVPDKNGVVNSGSFGSVYKGIDVHTQERLIWKKVKKVEINEVLIPLQFPNQDSLARVYGFSWDGVEATIVQEDAGTSLRQLISHKDELPLLAESGRIEKIMQDVFKGIALLAAHGITHCDIKPENICVNMKTGRAKLIDLGSCKTRQDPMNYSGITPEYLPPGPNTFIYNMLVQKTRSPMPCLGEKDDVWAAGLVGLYLLIGGHPMIQWVTGFNDYIGTAEEKQRMRCEVMGKISQLHDDGFSLDHDNVKVMLKTLLTSKNYTRKNPIVEELLEKVLVVDKDKRLTSAEAVQFLQKNTELPQPPRKAQRLQQRSQTEELDMFVDLRIAKNGSFSLMPDSPPVDQFQPGEQPIGVALKNRLVMPQMGNILAPVKFYKQSRQQREPLQQPWNYAPPYQVTPPAPSRPPEASLPAPPPMVEQDSAYQVYRNMQEEHAHDPEYDSLVNSFVNPTQGLSQQADAYSSSPFQPALYRFTGHQAESAGFILQPSALDQPNMDVHQHQPYDENESYLTGPSFFAPSSGRAEQDQFWRNFAKNFRTGQKSDGNVPAMEVLMGGTTEADEDGGYDSRPKLKATRRYRPSQD